MNFRSPTQLWAGRALVTLAALAVLVALWPNARSLYDLTGEEQLRGQAAGVVHWLNTAIRPQPRLDLAAVAASPLTAPAVSPFGVNTFLEQEAEPAKRAQILDLARAAGLRFIRQEFTVGRHRDPWQGRFHRPAQRPDGGVDAWAKYDHIVEPWPKRS
jgi:hypothetical protein